MSSSIRGKINCKSNSLNLKLTLLGGQSFRWKCVSDSDKSEGNVRFQGVAMDCFWELTQHDETECLEFEAVPLLNNKTCLENLKSTDFGEKLSNYFRMNFDLNKYFDEWKKSHKHFEETSTVIQSVRVLDQDPLENIISFICSQNNHVKRISTMVEWLCCRYGEKICTRAGVDYFSFPKLDALYKSEKQLEDNLRKAKFGYRSKFLTGTVRKIRESGGSEWLNKLKLLPYEDAREELVNLPGIGYKVADCICLMSLNHLQSVPVDTHIFKIAQNSYLPHLKQCKSVTPKIYDEVAKHFREIYGEYAGWAQTVLFCSGLQQSQAKNELSTSKPPKKKKK